MLLEARATKAVRRNYSALTGLLVVTGVLLCARPTMAQDIKSYTRATFDQWLAKYQDAKPDFKVGDVLTAKDMDKIRPFVFPGYAYFLNFPEFKMTIGASVDHTPRKDYMACTEKYQSQVKLLPDHTVGNYVCGQPFPNNSIKVGDPNAGWRAVWNYEYRWQNFGFSCMAPATWDRFGGTHDIPKWELPPTDWMSSAGWTESHVDPQLPSAAEMKMMYGGGGSFQRTLDAFYRKVFYTHLAMLPDHTLPVPDAAIFEFKEFTGFYSPFDIRGTAFIIYRYADPHREDDGWAYIPNLRRVRRISAEVKSDSLLGTDHTLEDFYSFSGRELEWHWRFLGWKDQLAVVDSSHEYTYLYGPEGIIPNDTWTLRRFAVMERTPLSPRHPYKSVVEDWDAQNYDAWTMEAFDHKDKLWKVWEFQKKWSETFKGDWQEAINKGAYSTEFQSVQVIDVQNDRGTIWIVPGGFPNVKGAESEKLFDINSLEQVHR
jgi:Protein of unknown function (DUF1329)